MILLSACDTKQPASPTTMPVVAQNLAIAALQEVDSVAEVRVSTGPSQWDPEMTDEALVAAIARVDGQVAIGVKPPMAPKTSASGLLHALSAQAILQARADLRAAGGRLVRTFRRSGTMIAVIDPKSAPLLRQAAWVNYLEPIHFLEPSQASQFVDSARQIPAIPWAWSYAGTQGAGTTITIIDSGIDSVHLASATGDGPANLAVCAYDATIAAGCYSGPIPHGAMVSGVFAARNNCCEAVGVSYGGTVNSIRTTNAQGLNPDGAVAAALDWASASGIQRHIVNLSIGGCDNGAVLHEAVARANATGIIVVAAAGNIQQSCSGGTQPGATGVTFPGAYAEVLTVSGTLNNDAFHPGSRYGAEVDISAPFRVYSTGFGGTWNYFEGTSFSTPLVSGVAALIWSQNPTWSASQVRARLLASAVDLGADGTDAYFGAGRVSAQNAVQPPFVGTIAGPQTISSPGTYTWSASASGPQPPYGVTWSYRNSGSSSWIQAGSGQSFSRSITATTPSFTLRATVTSPTWQGSTKPLYSVWVVIDGGGCSPLCEE